MRRRRAIERVELNIATTSSPRTASQQTSSESPPPSPQLGSSGMAYRRATATRKQSVAKVPFQVSKKWMHMPLAEGGRLSSDHACPQRAPAPRDSDTGCSSGNAPFGPASGIENMCVESFGYLLERTTASVGQQMRVGECRRRDSSYGGWGLHDAAFDVAVLDRGVVPRSVESKLVVRRESCAHIRGEGGRGQ